jgi:hypothetical protein
MKNNCGGWMMVGAGIGALLTLVLLLSLIVLVWVAIGRLRREPPGAGVSERR